MKRFIFILFLSGFPVSTLAQDDAAKAREAAELRVESEMVQLDNMAEAMSMNLGQLHYLRSLCFGETDQKWRSYAGQLIDLEAAEDSGRRENLIQAFNKGYYLEKERHNACSEALLNDVAALAENGRLLAGMLGDPYRED